MVRTACAHPINRRRRLALSAYPASGRNGLRRLYVDGSGRGIERGAGELLEDRAERVHARIPAGGQLRCRLLDGVPVALARLSNPNRPCVRCGELA